MAASAVKYIPGEIYKNLRDFVKHRGIVTDHTWMDTAKFSDTLNTYEYVKIEGKRVDSRGANLDVFIFLVMPYSSYATRTPNFKKLFNVIPRAKLDAAEVMFISHEEHSPHLKRLIDELRREHKGMYIETYDYSKFIIVIPEHVGVPRHEIASKEEVDDWCEKYGVARDELKKIHSSDPPAVWIGAKPGDVVKIHRPSESAGKAVVYRLCING